MSSRGGAGLKQAAYRMTMAVEPPEPALTDGVVTLRPWGEAGDVEAIVDACNDRAIAEFLDMIPQPYTESDALAYIDGMPGGVGVGQDDELRRRRQAEHRSARSASAGSRSPKTESRSATGLRAEARGTGPLHARALKLVSGWLFEDHGVMRLQLRADEENAASKKVAENAGFIARGSAPLEPLQRRGSTAASTSSCTRCCPASSLSRRRRRPTAARPSSGRAGSRGQRAPR